MKVPVFLHCGGTWQSPVCWLADALMPIVRTGRAPYGRQQTDAFAVTLPNVDIIEASTRCEPLPGSMLVEMRYV